MKFYKNTKKCKYKNNNSQIKKYKSMLIKPKIKKSSQNLAEIL